MNRIECAIVLGCVCGMGPFAYAEEKSEVITAIEVNVNGEVLQGQEAQEALDALPGRLGDLVQKVTESAKAAAINPDANGDGKVDAQEKQAAGERLREQIERWRDQSKARRDLNKYDKNKDGILSDTEKRQMQEDQLKMAEAKKQSQIQDKQALLRAYDKDANGQLDADEISALRTQAQTLLADLNVILAGEAALRAEEDKTLMPVAREIRSGLHGGLNQGWSVVRSH